MRGNHSEWLVADQRGSFAMGTCTGIRTRKYHGFQMGIPGRSQRAFLLDLDLVCNGVALWPHCYSSPEGPIYFPPLEDIQAILKFQLTDLGPTWVWTLPQGKLKMRVRASVPSGIWVGWEWTSRRKKPANLVVRGFWGMRDLHALGGHEWTWKMRDFGNDLRLGTITVAESNLTHCILRGNWAWQEDPKWYWNFHYSEELQRGYPADESLFSAGLLEVQLQSSEMGEWILSEDPMDWLEASFISSQNEEPKRLLLKKAKSKIGDFVLTRPAGIVAGFPWFGEWGRDTFISLPGIAAASLQMKQEPEEVWVWVREVLHRWGNWIETDGMLPNLVGVSGEPQWESSDATLWWCHSLAALWSFSLGTPSLAETIQKEWCGLLWKALSSIRDGRHRFLKENADGLLEVTEAHSTWMDARIHGVPVTPRLGLLPEMNALWFEACCLHWIWDENETRFDLEKMAKAVLQCKEPDRPNGIFMHSLPLAPSFVLRQWDLLERELIEIAENFWTPVGLRTLRPTHPHFKAHCTGNQESRDRSYHQGPVWAWLGGHYEMALNRLARTPVRRQERHRAIVHERLFHSRVLAEMPIAGHIPEIFDAEPPFTPRGTPAQAWSLACLEEAKARLRLKTDGKVTQILTQRMARSSATSDAKRASLTVQLQRPGEEPEQRPSQKPNQKPKKNLEVAG